MRYITYLVIYIKVFVKPNINNYFLSRNKMAANKNFQKSFKYLGGIIRHHWPRIFN